jgi:hypothetical protein
MNHAGPIAESQWNLYLIVAAVLVFVAGPVLIMVPLIAWHYRLSNREDAYRPNWGAYRPNWGFSWPIEILTRIPPIGIVIGLGFLLWTSTHRLDPYRPLASSVPPVEVQAVALDWKWLFIYPDERIATVNQLAIPVDRPVHFSLTRGTVMQLLLYAIEDEVRGSPTEQRRAARAAHSRVIMEDPKPSLQAPLRQVSAKSKLAEAIGCALAGGMVLPTFPVTVTSTSIRAPSSGRSLLTTIEESKREDPPKQTLQALRIQPPLVPTGAIV